MDKKLEFMDNSKDKNNQQVNFSQIIGIIREGRKKGRQLGEMEVDGAFSSFRAHAINDEHLAEAYRDYILESQLAYVRHNSFYKIAVTGFRNSKDKIIAGAKLYNEIIDPDDEEEEIKFAASMYQNFMKYKPDFGNGVDIVEEINDLENVVTSFEILDVKKRRLDGVINEVNERRNGKKEEKHSIINKNCQIFKTVWEAVLYHSVLVDAGIRKYYSKKDLEGLVSKMFLNNGEDNISRHSFYNKLLAIPSARKGEKTKEGRYRISYYESVKKLLTTEYPEALMVLKDRYFYSQLC